MVASIMFIYLFYSNYIDVLFANMISYATVHDSGTDFVPFNSRELLITYSSISSKMACFKLCHTNVQCRTFVYDSPTCRLYESQLQTGQIITAASASSLVGEILYNNINLSSSYNQSCDRCYPDRYLVCKDSRCQCPPNTYWDGISKCLNQLYVDSTTACSSNNWCREDMNMTCLCGKCRCPPQTYWLNKTCVPQRLAGESCNNSAECRNDLHIVCARNNKTCSYLAPQYIQVLNASTPAVLNVTAMVFNWTGNEWYRAFNNKTNDYWNGNTFPGANYAYLTFNDYYLLTSFQVTARGDYYHDIKTLEFYRSANGTCLLESFDFAAPPSTYYTYSATSFNYQTVPITGSGVLANFWRWSTYQLWLSELTFYGIPY